ncbi:MAG: hypothetical protein Q9220_007144 [cf. Caloplaca sp. 1 TL-2023]
MAPVKKPISISLTASGTKPFKSTVALSSSSSLNPQKRPHSSLNDDSDSDPDDCARERSPQLVASFDHSAGGAIGINGAEKPKAELVIQGLKNRDWREESGRKRRKNLLPREVQARRSAERQNGDTTTTRRDVERDEVSQISGLSFVKKEQGKESDEMVGMVEAQVVKPAKTMDEEALEALMGDGGRKSTLVVPAVVAEEASLEEISGNGRAGANEDDLFRFDVASRPDSASIDDYARVPVEEFGLGMLRGMGWKEGEVVGKRKDQISKARVVERRPALLGIGAKEVPGGVGDELGAWGKVAKGKRKVEKTYNPVLLKNTKTGEMMTEEELQARKEEQRKKVTRDEHEGMEWRERRDKNLAIDAAKKDEQRKRDHERRSRSRRRDRSTSLDSRHSSSRRERSRSSERRRDASRKDRSKFRERRHHGSSSSRIDYDDGQSDKVRKREKYEGDDSRSSRHGREPREHYDDTRRRRHEVY